MRRESVARYGLMSHLLPGHVTDKCAVFDDPPIRRPVSTCKIGAVTGDANDGTTVTAKAPQISPA